MPRLKRLLFLQRSELAIATLTQQECKYIVKWSTTPWHIANLIHSYGTEKAVGKAIKQSGVPRNEIFITTKLWNNKHHPDDVGPALQESLDDLGVEYVDLFLMHWPVAFKRGDEMFPKDKDGNVITDDIDYVDVSCILPTFLERMSWQTQTYKAMEKLLKDGKVKAIGISNFAKKEVERVLQHADVVPAVHQMELHPWLQQKEFMDFHQEKGIHVTQYSPFGNQNETYGGRDEHGQLVNDKTLVEIGKKYGKSSNQVALGKSSTTGHPHYGS